MSSNFEEFFASGFRDRCSERDQKIVDELVQAQGRIMAAALVMFDELRIDPNPVLHVHKPHEDTSQHCLWSAVAATLGGLIVANCLTAKSVENVLMGSVLSTAAFLTVEIVVELGIYTTIKNKAFVEWFHWFYLPFCLLFLGSATVILLGRVAGPDLADILISVTPWALCVAELSLLFVGAIASVGFWRFRWSGRFFAEFADLQRQIDELKHNRRAGHCFPDSALADEREKHD